MKETLLFFLFLFVFLFSPSSSFASSLFHDNFQGISGQVLSQRDSHWFFNTIAPGISNSQWGEYKIFNNMAQDGNGSIFDQDGLQVTLPTHFKVSENFIFSPNILVNQTQNQVFIDMRLYDSNYSSNYLLRFWPLNTDNTTNMTVQNLGIGSHITSLIGSYNPSGTNIISVEYNSGNIMVTINGIMALSFTDTSMIPEHLVIDQVINTAYITDFQLDDLTSIDLAVPSFKQTDPSWGANEYDSAHIWSPNAQTIGNYGCALTSAAMVFKFNGINKLPDGITNLDPGTLNTWLKGEKDGYVGQGYLNWLALSRLSKKSVAVNNITAFDALEYSLTNSEDKTKLTLDLQNNLPDILQVKGSTPSSMHFIVAKGANGTTFDINDPYFNRDTLANGYNDSFVSFGTFTPSHTDLSYMLFVIPSSFHINVTDQNGTSVSEEVLQNPIEDDTNSGSPANPVNLIYVPKPNSGEYTADVSGSSGSSYSFDEYLYDTQGEVNVSSHSGSLGESDGRYIISFDKTNNANDTTQKGVTLQDLQGDLQKACDIGKVKFGTCTALMAILKLTNLNKNAKPLVSVELNAAMSVLNAQQKWVDPATYQLLFSDLQYLQSHV